MAGIELHGVEEFLEAVQRKLEAGADRVINRGLKAGGQVIADEMVRKVGRSNKNGAGYVHMQDDIRVSGVRIKDGAKYVLVGPGKKTRWRAHFIEHGTIHARAKPFIYNSYHEKKDEAMQVMAEEFRKGMEEG